MVERKCLNCGEVIPEERRSDVKWCSNRCGNAFRRKDHYKKNPEYYARKRLEADSKVENRILTRIKSRAKRDGIQFDLDLEDIIVPIKCPVLGIQIITIPRGGCNQYGSPSVDRIIPELGYTKGNIRVISGRANLLKSNATVEELEKVLEDLRRLRETSL